MSFLDSLKGLFGRNASTSVAKDEPLQLRSTPTDTDADHEPPPSDKHPVALPTGPVDFVAVLNAAGVGPEQRRHVTRAQDLLRSMPVDATAALKRQIVEAAFHAFEIPIHEITRAASSEIDALNAYIAEAETQQQRALDKGTQRIEELEAEISRVKETIAGAAKDQTTRTTATRQEIFAVQPVLKFFVGDVVSQVLQETAAERAGDEAPLRDAHFAATSDRSMKVAPPPTP